MASNDRINEILSDDAVQYISGRHNMAPQDLIGSVASDDGRSLGGIAIDDNEYRIIRDLIRMYNKFSKGVEI